MTEWYYATADGQQHGPVAQAQLRALADAGTIDAQTLVWRDGLPQWQPLHQLAAEIGAGALPPPLPGIPFTPSPVPPPRSGMSGCLIALLAGVAALVLVSVLGILAAIAVPAYHQYLTRSVATAAITEAKAQQAAVTGYMASHEGRCPSNDEDGFGSAESYAGPHLASVVFGEFEGSDLCGLEATIRAPGKDDLDGHAIWLEYDPETAAWTCTSEVADRLLPTSCRG